MHVTRPQKIAFVAAGAGALALAGLYKRARRRRSEQDSRVALAGAKGSHLEQVITIARPPKEVYQFWHDPARLGTALPPAVTVSRLDKRHWRWALTTGAVPAEVTWTAEIINDEPGKLIGWKTPADADVVSAGSVHFDEVPGGTSVRVRMQYSPPLGKLGATLASAFGQGAEALVSRALDEVKKRLESAK